MSTNSCKATAHLDSASIEIELAQHRNAMYVGPSLFVTDSVDVRHPSKAGNWELVVGPGV